MHDLDRTTAEFEFEDALQEFEYQDNGAFEADGAYEYEGEDEYEDREWEGGYDSEYEPGSPFSEEEEMELATELLDVNSEAELDQFLGKLFRKVGRIGRRLGRKVFRGLKKIAKVALPAAGGALGAMFGGPIGGSAGSFLGKNAGKLFGLELEGMSYEDQEFEMAKRFVNLAGETIQQAAELEQRRVPVDQAANTAFKKAARRHAPGLLKPARRNRSARPAPPPPAVAADARPSATGRWVRYGDKVVLFGLDKG